MFLVKKNNQHRLKDAVSDLFEQAGTITNKELKLGPLPEHFGEQFERGHGRLEKRVCCRLIC
jgi:hypothetical protein